MYGYPMVIRPGPRSLHFRGRRPIPRLPELAHAAALGRSQRPLPATKPAGRAAPRKAIAKARLLRLQRHTNTATNAP